MSRQPVCRRYLGGNRKPLQAASKLEQLFSAGIKFRKRWYFLRINLTDATAYDTESDCERTADTDRCAMF